MAGGFIDFLSGKEPKQDLGTGIIKDELKKQDKWIRHLHDYSRDLHRYTDSINESNIRHKKEIVFEITKINQWVSHLYESNKSLKQEMASLKTELKEYLKRDFGIYHKTIEEYIKLKFAEEEEKQQKLRENVLEEIKQANISNAGNAKQDNVIMHYNAKADLTNPEKELLNLLFNESKPMTYEAIAKKLNKSVNSVRVYMNSLRVKKQIIDEFLTPSGSKVFSIKNSELVKTLFNII